MQHEHRSIAAVGSGASFMAGDERPRIEAHRKAQWLAYETHRAELEELHALERAYEAAAEEVLVLRARLLDARLDRRRAELAWRTLHLARESVLADSFRRDLREIIERVADPRGIVRMIREMLKPLPCNAIDWRGFDARFRQSYPEFIVRLIERFPDLTRTEVKVCRLMRLKLASRDVAKLLCLSERSVQRHRANLRRKMGLAGEVDIAELLAEM